MFFVLGGRAATRIAADAAPRRARKLLFVAAICIILIMYGGGFATVPAYLADLFGHAVGRRDPRAAAHGLGDGRHPRPGGRQLHARLPARPGIPREQVYNQTMYILVGMLVVGLICNALVRPVDPKWYMSDADVAALQAAAAGFDVETAATGSAAAVSTAAPRWRGSPSASRSHGARGSRC